MPEEEAEEEAEKLQSLPSVSVASEQNVERDVSDLGDALGQDMLTSFKEKPADEALQELDQLEKKIEALIAHCETLNVLNKTLGEQLNKERALRARIEEVNGAARRRVDQLIQRLRDLEATEK